VKHVCGWDNFYSVGDFGKHFARNVWEKKNPRKKTHIKILQYFADSMLILNRGISCRCWRHCLHCSGNSLHCDSQDGWWWCWSFLWSREAWPSVAANSSCDDRCSVCSTIDSYPYPAFIWFFLCSLIEEMLFFRKFFLQIHYVKFKCNKRPPCARIFSWSLMALSQVVLLFITIE